MELTKLKARTKPFYGLSQVYFFFGAIDASFSFPNMIRELATTR